VKRILLSKEFKSPDEIQMARFQIDEIREAKDKAIFKA
jgi:hypothetical protein